MTSGIARRQNFGAGFSDMSQFFVEDFLGQLRFEQVVDARATATNIATVEHREFQIGNCPQHSERGIRGMLTVQQMA